MNQEVFDVLARQYKKKYGHKFNGDLGYPSTQFKQNCPICASTGPNEPNYCLSIHSEDYSWFTGTGKNPDNAIGWYKSAYFKGLTDAAREVCEMCASCYTKPGPYVPFKDDNKEVHIWTNVNKVQQLTPCKAASIWKLLKEDV